jgi:hypothetical protein
MFPGEYSTTKRAIIIPLGIFLTARRPRGRTRSAPIATCGDATPKKDPLSWRTGARNSWRVEKPKRARRASVSRFTTARTCHPRRGSFFRRDGRMWRGGVVRGRLASGCLWPPRGRTRSAPIATCGDANPKKDPLSWRTGARNSRRVEKPKRARRASVSRTSTSRVCHPPGDPSLGATAACGSVG